MPGSAHELREQVELHESVDLLTHVTYASIMTLLTAADRIEPTLPENAARIRAYVKDAQERDVRITQCITDAKGDRSRRPGLQDDPDAYVRVVSRNADGIVIRGAKLHISAASMGHELMTIPTKSMKADEGQYSVACMVPVNAPGVKIVNTTYAPRHEDKRDFPMSGQPSHAGRLRDIRRRVRAERTRVPRRRSPRTRRHLRALAGFVGTPRRSRRHGAPVRRARRLRAVDLGSERPRKGRAHQREDLRDDDQCDADSRKPRGRADELPASRRTARRFRTSCTPTSANTTAPPTIL